MSMFARGANLGPKNDHNLAGQMTMPASVRQSILWTIVAVFLAGNLVLPAFLWNRRVPAPIVSAGVGALVAEPMLMAVWLGLARQEVKQRLALALGLGLIGSLTYALGTFLSGERLTIAVYMLFVVSGLGATILASGLFRAHRFLLGVLIAESELASDSSGWRHRPDAAPCKISPFDEPSSSTPEIPELISAAAPSSRELQFGVGYLIAMTSAVAIVFALLRGLAAFPGPSWPVLFLFGWTFFVYSALATLVTVASVLTTRRRQALRVAAVAYTLFAPLATVPIIGSWQDALDHPMVLANLYAFAVALALTLAIVASVLRRQGYPLRHGWL